MMELDGRVALLPASDKAALMIGQTLHPNGGACVP